MRAPVQHELKCWPQFFGAVASGDKPFELRRNDRPEGYKVGDSLKLREWMPGEEVYTGRTATVRVTYVLTGDGPSGLLKGFVVMGVRVVSSTL